MAEDKPVSEWGEQDEWGNDLEHLRYNLKLTVEERIAQHNRAARFALECMRATERAGLPRITESSQLGKR